MPMPSSAPNFIMGNSDDWHLLLPCILMTRWALSHNQQLDKSGNKPPESLTGSGEAHPLTQAWQAACFGTPLLLAGPRSASSPSPAHQGGSCILVQASVAAHQRCA